MQGQFMSIMNRYLTEQEGKIYIPEASMLLLAVDLDKALDPVFEALKEARDCLQNWVDIADEEDLRDYDYDALARVDEMIQMRETED